MLSERSTRDVIFFQSYQELQGISLKAVAPGEPKQVV